MKWPFTTSEKKFSALVIPKSSGLHKDFSTYFDCFSRNTIVFRCINILSQNLSKIPLINQQTLSQNLLYEITRNLMIFGNVFLVNNVVQNIIRINLKKLSDYQHLFINRSYNDIFGISPISVCLPAIQTHGVITDYMLSLMQNGGKPWGIFSCQKTFVSDKYNMQEQMHDLYDKIGKNASFAFIEGDYKWETIGLSPKELMILEMRVKLEREICNIFGIPPVLLGIEDVTFSNFKEARRYFWLETIIPLATLIIDQFNMVYDLEITIDVDNILNIQE